MQGIGGRKVKRAYSVLRKNKSSNTKGLRSDNPFVRRESYRGKKNKRVYLKKKYSPKKLPRLIPWEDVTLQTKANKERNEETGKTKSLQKTLSPGTKRQAEETEPKNRGENRQGQTAAFTKRQGKKVG